MNTVFFAILILLILYTNFRIGRKINKQNKAWIQQHAKQFELFQILHEAVSTEQYEAAQDIQQLINQVRQTIKTYSCR